MQTRKKFFLALQIISALGMLVSAYLVYKKFAPLGESFCDINDRINCDIVNGSKYAKIFDIPVAVLGLLSYTYFFIIALDLFKHPKLYMFIIPLSTLAAGFGLLFSLYLTYIEFYILQALCILCLMSQVLILLIFILFLTLWIKERKSLPQPL
ncbi:MAG: vitamin K epoxide reductase family protein [Patescibacteria group bacterium]